jgi:hypothetical protein
MSEKSSKLLEGLSKNIPAEVVQRNVVVAPPKEDTSIQELDADYEFSREKYKDLVDKGTLAIDSMMELALQSDHPRAFEVLGGMLKHVSDMTDKLMVLHNNVEKIKTVKEQNSNTPQVTSSGGSVTNNVFVGSTTDLQRFIIAQQNKTTTIDASEV